jgi:hypothetical protein
MAITETARLLASLELQDKISGPIKTIEGKLDGIGRKLEGVGTSAGRGVDTAKRKFGDFKTAIRDTNTQIGIVGTALAGLENFVPPNLRPFVRGLEDINNAAPRGLPGLVGTALQGLKTITANTVTVVGKAISSPGGAGGTGEGSRLLALTIAGAILTVATEIIGPTVRQWAIDNGLAGTGANAGKTDSQLARERAEAYMKRIAENTDRIPKGGSGGGVPRANFTSTFEDGSTLTRSAFQLLGQSAIPSTIKWIPADVVQIEDRRGESANAQILEKLEANRLATLRSKTNVTINVPVTIKNQSLGGTTTTVYSRYSTSVSGTGGNQI